MNNLIWFVFIKPYILQNGTRIPVNSTAQIQAFCQPSGGGCPLYVNLQGGELWALYDDPRNGSNSFEIIKEIVYEIMAEYGYRLDDIKIVAEMNKDMSLIPQF